LHGGNPMPIARRLSFLDHSFQIATSSQAELSAPTVIRTVTERALRVATCRLLGLGARFLPQIRVVNPIGSGDSLLAGLVDGWLNRLEPEPLIRHAIGSAIANAMVWDAGAIEPGEVARWSKTVVIEPVTEPSGDKQVICPRPRLSSACPPSLPGSALAFP
jgi:hypothetical protein